jgi:hypothetical protein
MVSIRLSKKKEEEEELERNFPNLVLLRYHAISSFAL